MGEQFVAIRLFGPLQFDSSQSDGCQCAHILNAEDVNSVGLRPHYSGDIRNKCRLMEPLATHLKICFVLFTRRLRFYFDGGLQCGPVKLTGEPAGFLDFFGKLRFSERARFNRRPEDFAKFLQGRGSRFQPGPVGVGTV